jgi:hypothetical protein
MKKYCLAMLVTWDNRYERTRNYKKLKPVKAKIANTKVNGAGMLL